MLTRIIYDVTGHILDQRQGSDLYTPIGVPYLDIEIPQDKFVSIIDVSITPNVPVFEDLPKSEIEIANTRIELAEQAINDLMDIIVGGM